MDIVKQLFKNYVFRNVEEIPLKTQKFIMFNLIKASIIHNRPDIYEYVLELMPLSIPVVDCLLYNHTTISNLFKKSLLYQAILKADSQAVADLLVKSGTYLNLCENSPRDNFYHTFYYPRLKELLCCSLFEFNKIQVKSIEIILDNFYIEPNDFPISHVIGFLDEVNMPLLSLCSDLKEIYNRFKILHLFLKKGAKLKFYNVKQILFFILYFSFFFISAAPFIFMFHLIVDVLIYNLTGKDLCPKDSNLRQRYGYLFRKEPEI